MPEFLSIRALAGILHLIGLVVGMGGALIGDAIFLSSVRDRKFTATEIRFLRIAGRFAWFGLVLLIISGAVIFALNTERYLASSKFIAKMVIVGVIITNGIVFHTVHIPRLARHAGIPFWSSPDFIRHAKGLVASGAISITSWMSALILGALRNLPYSLFEILAVYAAVTLIAVAIAVALRWRILSGDF